MTADPLDGDLPGGRQPVRVHQTGRKRAAPPPGLKADRRERLDRRLDGLRDGRHMLVVTVRAGVIIDWSVLELGRVEGSGGMDEGWE
mgnify:CR=1 FL=1